MEFIKESLKATKTFSKNVHGYKASLIFSLFCDVVFIYAIITRQWGLVLISCIYPLVSGSVIALLGKKDIKKSIDEINNASINL